MKLRYYILILCGLGLWLTPPSAKAQGQQSAILFSGYVIDGKTEQPLISCSVLIQKAGRGTTTNTLGYFAIPVYPGDTIIFRYLGYKHQYHLIPKITAETYSAVIELKEDAKLLQEVKVYPYRTEQEFKEAFINYRLPDEKQREALAKATDPEYLQRMAAVAGMGAAGNYRYFMNQQNNAQANRNFMSTNSLLNPFAWANFIKSIKRGDLKKKDWQDAFQDLPPENIKRSDFIRKQGGN